MSPVDAAVVRRKLAHILATIETLRPIAGFTLAEYRARVWERKATERLLQEAIEAALDVNYGTFLRLADLGIISPDLARAVAPSAGLRNRLVHEYDEIDDAKVLASVSSTLQIYPRFVQSIETWLETSGF